MRNDGIDRTTRKADKTRPLSLAGAGAALAAAALLWFGGRGGPAPERAPSAGAAPARPEAAADVRGPNLQDLRVVRLRPRDEAIREAERRAEQARAAGEEEPRIDARDYIAALRAEGETGGLAAFNPPGTRPPQPGIIVPEDYELPEGYVRSYQATDDGRQLRPILTLSPDYQVVDADGNPIDLGPDRIVPPELAPPDLPIETLEVPPSRHGD